MWPGKKLWCQSPLFFPQTSPVFQPDTELTFSSSIWFSSMVWYRHISLCTLHHAQLQKIALNKESKALAVQLLQEGRASPGSQCSSGKRAPITSSFQTACIDICFARLPFLFSTAIFQGKWGMWSSLPTCLLFPLLWLFFNLLTFLHLWFFHLSSLFFFFIPM